MRCNINCFSASHRCCLNFQLPCESQASQKKNLPLKQPWSQGKVSAISHIGHKSMALRYYAVQSKMLTSHTYQIYCDFTVQLLNFLWEIEVGYKHVAKKKKCSKKKRETHSNVNGKEIRLPSLSMYLKPVFVKRSKSSRWRLSFPNIKSKLQASCSIFFRCPLPWLLKSNYSQWLV